MLIIVNKINQSKYLKELASMHHLRKKVFKDTLKWDVHTVNSMEFDQFDTDDAHYLIHINEEGEADACTRLLCTTNPYLLGDVFPELLLPQKPPKKKNIWETTRFCSDQKTAPKDIMAILLAGMLEFAIDQGIKEYVSVSDIRIEPLLRRNGWPAKRLGKTIYTGTDTAAAEKLTVNTLTLNNVLSKCVYTTNVKIKNLHEINYQNPLKKVA